MPQNIRSDTEYSSTDTAISCRLDLSAEKKSAEAGSLLRIISISNQWFCLKDRQENKLRPATTPERGSVLHRQGLFKGRLFKLQKNQHTNPERKARQSVRPVREETKHPGSDDQRAAPVGQFGLEKACKTDR